MHFVTEQNQDHNRAGIPIVHYSLILCTLIFTMYFVMNDYRMAVVLEPMKLELQLTAAYCGTLLAGLILFVAAASTRSILGKRGSVRQALRPEESLVTFRGR